jgi:hypothetical protein
MQDHKHFQLVAVLHHPMVDQEKENYNMASISSDNLHLPKIKAKLWVVDSTQDP